MIVWYKYYEEWRGKISRRFESPKRKKLRLRLEQYERKKSNLKTDLYLCEQEIFRMKKELGEI